MDVIIGQTLARQYRVVEFIAAGGMARVYRVWDLKRGVDLAIKVLREDTAGDTDMLYERFREEAGALAALQHPNIVRFYEIVHDQGLTFIVLDYVDGSTLRDQIQNRQRAFSREWMLEVFRPVCSALNYAHQKGIVHCDVKPGNILISRAGKVLLTDFGIAQTGERQDELLPGTPVYMAPEQVRSQTVSAQTDIYALGVVLYEMATNGRRPFEGRVPGSTASDREQVRWEQVNQTPPTPRRWNPALSGEFEQIIGRCLEKRSPDRYASTLDLLSALERGAMVVEPERPTRTETPSSPAPEPQTKRANPLARLWWLVVVAVGLVLALMAVMLRPGGGAPISTHQNYPYPDHCAQFVMSDAPRIEIKECVTSVDVLPDGRLRVNFSWKVTSEGGSGLKIEADVGNQNMYLTDNTGKRLNHVQVGGQAAQSVTLYNGNTKQGWFLFPPADPRASELIFHDDDNGVQLPPLERKWP